MKKAIVTGANGFIGSHVVKELLNQNIYVYAVVRNNANNLDKHPNLKIVACDLKHANTLIDKIQDRHVDYFYHFAWQGVSGIELEDYQVQLQNINNTLSICSMLDQFGVDVFIGAGSLHEKECLVEMADNQVSLNMGLMYKSAKVAAHHMSKVIVCKKNIRFVWPIITNTYGVGEKSKRLIISTIKNLLHGVSPKFTKATQLYDFIYITDLARAFYLLAENGVTCKEYFIGSGDVKPLYQYLEEVGSIVNSDIELGFGQLPFHGISLTRECLTSDSLYQDTKFKPTIDFAKGVKLICNWIKEKEENENV